MKVKVTKFVHDVHDITVGNLYDTIKPPSWAGYVPQTVWVINDVGEDYILYNDEFEWVFNESN